MRLQLLRRKENPILPLRQSKLLINKHLDCYCPTVTVSFLNCYCLTSPKIFNNIWSYRTLIEVILVSLESLDMMLQVIWKKENPVLPLRQSKLLINKYLDCYCPTVTVSFLNCYCLTSSHTFNYIWSYRTLIQVRLVSLES